LLRKLGGSEDREAVLKYDRTKGFRATSETDLALVRSILKKTLNEDVEVLLSCFICGNIVDCNRCRYGDTCGGVTSFQSCVCKNCEKSEEAQSIYSIRFAQLLT
jgi:hypothetical protein